MNFVSLAIHGLSAVSVFGDRAGVRLITATFSLCVVNFLVLVSIVPLNSILDPGVPPWFIYSAVVGLMVLFPVLLTSILFVFVILAGRDGASTIPLRDHLYYLSECQTLYDKHRRVQICR